MWESLSLDKHRLYDEFKLVVGVKFDWTFSEWNKLKYHIGLTSNDKTDDVYCRSFLFLLIEFEQKDNYKHDCSITICPTNIFNFILPQRQPKASVRSYFDI